MIPATVPELKRGVLDRTVILFNASGEEAPTKKASASIALCVCLPHRSYKYTLAVYRQRSRMQSKVLGPCLYPNNWVPVL